MACNRHRLLDLCKIHELRHNTAIHHVEEAVIEDHRQWIMIHHQWVRHHLAVIVHSINHRADHLVNSFHRVHQCMMIMMMMSHDLEEGDAVAAEPVVVVEEEADSEEEGGEEGHRQCGKGHSTLWMNTVTMTMIMMRESVAPHDDRLCIEAEQGEEEEHEAEE